MSPGSHVAASVTAAAIIKYFVPGWEACLACLLVGIFIDADHFLDFYLEPKVNHDLRNFYRLCQECAFKKVRLVLHSCELIIPFGLLFYFYGARPLLVGIFIGYLHHLILDNLFNPVKSPYTYFLTYRWRKAFQMSEFFIQKRKAR